MIATGKLSPLSETERHLLSSDERENHVRLACMTTVIGECEITDVYRTRDLQIATNTALPDFALAPSFERYGVAVDIGTTTLVAQLYDATGNRLAETARLNPQTLWGADVISRIEAAINGNDYALSASIREAVDDMLLTLSNSAGIEARLIDGVVITGNTAMLYLLVGESVEPLSHAPFEAKRLLHEEIPAAELSLSALSAHTPVYLPPCISAFVGADVVCGLMTLALSPGEAVLFADIGTNGEIALWDGTRLTVCSTAAGPAFEGVGISAGMRGESGAIDKVYIEGDALCVHTINGEKARGLCGSGLIDLLACLLDREILDESGFLEESPYAVADGISLTQKDVRMVQLAKSAIRAGIDTLLCRSGLTENRLTAIAIAGGFSRFMDVQNAVKIGLLPSSSATKATVLGNAALNGAALLLLNRSSRDGARHLSRCAQMADLSNDPTFKDLYMDYMLF
ncbi:MAG: DUF4445 domain-containing protein [Clostridia bacterium]|nr:DUF4445 domain-containing protein [Clostridia bacterium]